MLLRDTERRRQRQRGLRSRGAAARPGPGGGAVPAGAHPRHQAVLDLQRLAGNGAVAGLVTASRAPGPIQRAKIDFQELAWADFKGRAPRLHTAATFSGMRPIPAKLTQTQEQEDSGTACTAGKTATTEFTARIAVDPATFDAVKSFMWQERSGAKADFKKGLAGATAKAVQDCKKGFDKEAKRIAGEADTECKRHVEPCKEAFRDGASSWSVEFEDEKVEVTEAKRCAKGMPKDCRAAFAAAFPPSAFDFEVKTTTSTACPDVAEEVVGSASASTKADCAAGFKNEVGELNKGESDRLLHHEQIHFNITEQATTALRDELRTAAEPMTVEETACGRKAAIAKARKAFAALGARASLLEIWNKAEADRDATQDRYDAETCHGLDQAAQETWNADFP